MIEINNKYKKTFNNLFLKDKKPNKEINKNT